jgi:hypothetical protein
MCCHENTVYSSSSSSSSGVSEQRRGALAVSLKVLQLHTPAAVELTTVTHGSDHGSACVAYVAVAQQQQAAAAGGYRHESELQVWLEAATA